MKEQDLYLPGPVAYVISRLESVGHHAYSVGGCVRDHLMGRIPDDYDVTTSAKPEEMLKVFENDRVVLTGLKHGTLTVVRDGMNVETTTYRIDGTYADGRHPDSVIFTDRLSDDLCRRDFTINAMAYSPERGIVDLFGGREDLASRTIRCVGDARDRFQEDGLRILRALRFASVLDFTLDGPCAEAVVGLAPLLGRISRERIFTELYKLMNGPAAERILRGYPSVIREILPELSEEDVVRAAGPIGRSLELLPSETSLRFAILFSGIGFEAARSALCSLKTSRAFSKSVLCYLIEASRPVPKEDGDVLRLMSRTDDRFPERLASYGLLLGLIEKGEADSLQMTAEQLIREDRCHSLGSLAVSGRDLMERGLSGAAVGDTLKKMLDAVMDGSVPNERGALLTMFFLTEASDDGR